MPDFGLIGYPLTHSFSKKYFEKKFRELNLSQHHYHNFEINSLDSLEAVITNNSSLTGLNVTIPYKEKIIPLLHAIEDEAVQVGAVNTIKIIRTDNAIKLWGFNTDITGFEKTLQFFDDKKYFKALIFGNGGAAKAVRYILQKQNIAFDIVSRNNTKNSFTFLELEKVDSSAYDLLINCTPVGMYPQEEMLPIPNHFILPQHTCIDLIYNPELTPFLKQAASRNCRISNGSLMLHTQAEAAWEIWNSNSF
ncbi:MAG: shikimate dehydrogenase [Bacteroidetes bacterium]|nr:shikimate dehydrogenase [Bacteroidota bacterium]